jgi:hypothetical protein
MRFMILRLADKDTEAGIMPSQELLAAMGKYMEELATAGILLDGEGLQPTSKGVRVKFSKCRPKVKEGPFKRSKNLIAGYAMIQVKSKEEAIEWVKRWPILDANGEVELEIRQVFEADDFGTEFTPELREREARMRAELAAKK